MSTSTPAFSPFKIDAIHENVPGDGLIELFIPTRLVPFSKLVFSFFAGKMSLNSHSLLLDNSFVTSLRDWPIRLLEALQMGQRIGLHEDFH